VFGCQVGKGDRGDVTILPTLVINQRQYRGKLEKAAVTKAICSGYKETTDPPVCLSQGNHHQTYPPDMFEPCMQSSHLEETHDVNVQLLLVDV
jgi:hypothetical protein